MVNILGFAISRYLVGRENSGLLAESGKFLQHDNPESWDKTLSPLMGLGGGLIPVVAGLDARLGSGFAFPVWLQIWGLSRVCWGCQISLVSRFLVRFFLLVFYAELLSHWSSMCKTLIIVR